MSLAWLSDITTIAAQYLLTYWASALVHELAHAAVGRYYRLTFLRIQPGFVAWSCQHAGNEAWQRVMTNPRSRLAIAIAGWVSHLVLLGLALYAIGQFGAECLDGFAVRFAVVNALLAGLVAIPDGHGVADADLVYSTLKELKAVRQAKSAL